MATIFESIQELGTIITDAITAGNDDNIPPRAIRNTLIKVSTGKYYEVLPIIVPEECCVIGDELRSTNVQPRKESNGTLTSKTDYAYTYQTLDRFEQIVGDIVSGTGVTPTTGNTQTQDQTWPYAEIAPVGEAVTKAIRSIKRSIDSDLGLKLEAEFPRSYELADPNYGHARDLIRRNKDFIKAEIVGYITEEYPNIKYSRTKCKQDVGFIIDSIAYDLSYGGNWQSTNAGLAYYNGNSGTLQIDSTEKTATLAAYGYLKEILQTVGRDIVVTPGYQDDIDQLRGLGGSTTVSNTISDLMDDITDIINNGPNVASITYPDVSGVASNLTTASTNVVNGLPTVQEKTIDFISKNFGSFKYDSAKCRRDLTNILTDVAFDLALGTNYNATFNGIAYQRPNNAYNLQEQRVETVGAIRFARDEAVALLSDNTAITRTRAAFNEIVDIINNGNLGTSMPGDGIVDALVLPTPTGAAQNRIDAKDNLQANIDFIKADVIAYIANNYPSLNYNSDKCARDVEYIINAQSYDILYGGTQATTRIAESYFVNGINQVDGQTTETSAAYDHLASIMSDIVQEISVTAQSGNTEIQTTIGSPASATEGSEIQTNVELISDVIDGTTTLSAVQSARTLPSVTWATAGIQADKTTLDNGQADIIVDAIQYINTTYNDFNYDQAKCQRDLGLIVDAARYDWMLGTNFASMQAAYSYLRAPSSKVVGDQKTATIAANEFARQYIIDNNIITDATAIAGLNSTWEWIDDIIWSGSSEGGNKAVANQEVWNAIRMLELNKEFIVDELVAWEEEYFKDTVTATSNVDNSVTISSTSWLQHGMPFRIVSEDFTDPGTAGFTEGEIYYVKEILSATTFTVTDDNASPIITLASTTGTSYTIESTYEYNTALCKRDIREYIEALKYDMQWPQEFERNYTDGITVYRTGFYRSDLAGRYYVNSVNGSQEEDFFYLRNGTGLRLMTMDGLQGDMTPENKFGTSRVTAGAYASLDPGWGPDDKRAWITARSPYVQNCTTFGYAAIGQKIDGALHNGGNDSIVSNDFTQVISDGIGAWITNNGRAEMVSVFTYYSHIGYLCEAGGRARATNGNNSYGDFGSVAEGVDPEEIPVTAVVDNRTQYRASVADVFTDLSQILQLEYSHAGNEYTEALIDIFGAGTGEVQYQEEFRDDAVFQVRVDEINDSSGKAGGSGYTIVSNTAQSGSLSGIFLAATDGNLSSAYPGMKVLIVGGAGVGQYAIIDTYNAGSKEATVIRESDGQTGWDHIRPGTPIIAPNSSSTYQVEPAVSFTSPPKTDQAITVPTSTNTPYTGMKFVQTAAQYTDVATITDSDGKGATFDVTRNGSKYYLTINNGGGGYNRLDTVTIDGSNLGGETTTNDVLITITTINADTGAILDFDFDGYGQAGVFVGIAESNTWAYSADGITWSTATSKGAAYSIASGLQDDGSSTFKPSAIVTVSDENNLVNISADGETWDFGAALPAAITSASKKRIAYGNVIGTVTNRFVVISDNDTDVAYSDNGGTSWTTQAGALSGTGFNQLVYGAGKWVAISSGTTAAAYSTDGITWTDITLPAIASDLTEGGSGNLYGGCVFGNGLFVTLADDAASFDSTMHSLDGITWYLNSGSTPASVTAGTPYTMEYGQGIYVIGTGTTGNNTVAYSEDGIYWQEQELSVNLAAGQRIIGFGNPNKTGTFIGVSNGLGTTGVKFEIGATAKGRASVANEQVFEIRLLEPGSGYSSAPTVTVTDPNNIDDVILVPRVGKGALGQPTWSARGSNFTAASAEVNLLGSNGFADFFQNGLFVAVRRLSARPVAGSNIVFDSIPGITYKLVNTVSFRGDFDGSFSGFLQLSPEMSIPLAPPDGDPVTMRIRFSQVRLTGHDFLDIGTGGFVDTNYPGVPTNEPDQSKETTDSDGGRVFFTATDQDGNFRVGDLFQIEQATGVATLNAEAFNIAGLQELSLGEVTLGGNSASVQEFSTDPFFTANSDSVVPTQRAVKAYIEAQIGGGGATLNVNSVTAGDIFINTTQITTVSGERINVKANVNFEGAILGVPMALQYFLR